MKHFIIILLTTVICISGCQKEECIDNPYSGTWKLTGILVASEDGSGTFGTVDSDRTLTFDCENKVTSNGDLCILSPYTDDRWKGEYSMSGNRITLDDCPDGTIRISLFDNYIILDYPGLTCYEGCQAMYEKQ